MHRAAAPGRPDTSAGRLVTRRDGARAGQRRLFTRVVALSPGFEAVDDRVGRPELLVTHGVTDDVLPIDRTSRVLVPALRRAGYAVES